MSNAQHLDTILHDHGIFGMHPRLTMMEVDGMILSSLGVLDDRENDWSEGTVGS